MSTENTNFDFENFPRILTTNESPNHNNIFSHNYFIRSIGEDIHPPANLIDPQVRDN